MPLIDTSTTDGLQHSGAAIDPASFRDPAGRVIVAKSGVYRIVSPSAWSRVEQMQSKGLLDRLADAKLLWPAEVVDAGSVPPEIKSQMGTAGERVLEHPVLPFVSYPYEWPFALMKRAALLHLDLHLRLLEEGFNLVDGTAYNVQFVGARPVFIDTLSITPYADGDYWLGYQQFCTQFLNPLLLSAHCGVGYHAWFRGALEGIGVEDLARLLPWYRKFSLGVFSHVVLHAKLLARSGKGDASGAVRAKRRGPSKNGLVGLLRGLRAMINRLEPRGLNVTRWSDYEKSNSYGDAETEAKRAFVAAFVQQSQPKVLWDFGCNTGAYSELALASGATRVVGFDFDLGALEGAVGRADDQGLDFLPLYLDATNPSPDQGWHQRERAGLHDRSNGDALLALAFLHHLVIGKNVPMDGALGWLVSYAPKGVVEFVPKNDPMVRQMLADREDIFPEYTIESFRRLLGNRARIVREQQVSESGRTLFLYER